MSIDVSEFGYTPVEPEDTFRFQCTCCGDCCRDVKDAIMLESLDMFRLVRFLKMDAKEFILQYTNMAFLSWGYPILLLRTTEPLDACVFLKDSRCSVHNCNPRACRTYPLGAGPDDENTSVFQSFIVSKKPHHFTGKNIRVGDWMDTVFTAEDRAFVTADYTATGEIVKLLRKIGKRYEDAVIQLMLFYRYLNFDTSKDFYRQFIENIACLKFALSKLTSEN